MCCKLLWLALPVRHTGGPEVRPTPTRPHIRRDDSLLTKYPFKACSIYFNCYLGWFRFALLHVNVLFIIVAESQCSDRIDCVKDLLQIIKITPRLQFSIATKPDTQTRNLILDRFILAILFTKEENFKRKI